MKAMILAAGFGTRMGEITKKTAKPLLEVGGKTITQHLAEKIFAAGGVDSLSIVSNNYYIEQFEKWAAEFGRPDVTVLNDGANSNETRLGAIADLSFAIKYIGDDSTLFMMAGDNLYEFDFGDMVKCQQQLGTDVVAAYRQPDVERLRKTGVISLDENNRIIDFEEKPQNPKSEFAVPCIYIFRPETLRLVNEYLDEGNNPDAPGNFIAWLHTRTPVHAFLFDTPMHAVGDAESYERVKKILGNS